MGAKKVCLGVCVSCSAEPLGRGRNGKKRANPANQRLAVELKHLLEQKPGGGDVQVRLTRCQQNCTNPCSWNLNSAGGEALQFGKAGAPGGPTAEDVAEVALAYAALPPGGKLEKASFPPRVKGTLVARVAAWPRRTGS